MVEKLKKVMSAVFEIEISQINEDSSPVTIEKWDSLKQMQLVVAMEEEFGIEFSDEEISGLSSYMAIKDIVEEKCRGQKYGKDTLHS